MQGLSCERVGQKKELLKLLITGRKRNYVHKRRTMYCPKCNHIMSQVLFEKITVDRCTNCKGIWFDHREIEQLQRLKGADIIDSGTENKGKAYDTIKEISCPKCNVSMEQRQDHAKDNLSYETCACCQGVFLDAGEYKKLADEKSILNFLKNLFQGRP
jgi:Zn-finger nucleic acid-binding protein